MHGRLRIYKMSGNRTLLPMLLRMWARLLTSSCRGGASGSGRSGCAGKRWRSIILCRGGEGEPKLTLAFLRPTASSSKLSSAEQGAPQMLVSSGSPVGAGDDNSARWMPACDVIKQEDRPHTHARNEANETFLAHISTTMRPNCKSLYELCRR